MAAVKILSGRRKAAPKFWAPQQDHPALRIIWKFMQAGRRGRRPLRVRNRMCGSDRRDDVGIVPYARFLFFPVGRGQCAPPLEVRCVSAAAHMGAALQRNLQNMRRGGGSAPPVHGHRIFIKLSFRGAQRRGNPFSPCSEGAVRGGCGCPCCGTQNFGAALRRPLKILTAATRSSRFFCHRQRSIRSPHRCAHRFAMTRILLGVRCMSAAG